MKPLLIIIFTVIFSCHSANSYRDSINDVIISFYEYKKEISNSNIKSLKNNFKELSNITNITTNAHFNDKDGIYLVRLNISHTTCNVLLVKNNNYKILSLEGNKDQVIDDFTLNAKNMDLYKINYYKDYEEIITMVLKDNNEMIDSMTLKPLE